MKKSLLVLAILGSVMVSCKDNASNTKAADTQDTQQVQQDTKKEALKYELQWTAFKTPQKVGVKGTFTDIQLNGVQTDASSLQQALTGATFVVVTSTVTTGDPVRDNTLSTAFFTKMVGNINGYFKSFSQDHVVVNVTMNGISKDKEFAYSIDDKGTLAIEGAIDIVGDFTAQSAFDSLHQACGTLHEGKSWTDVDLLITIKK